MKTKTCTAVEYLGNLIRPTHQQKRRRVKEITATPAEVLETRQLLSATSLQQVEHLRLGWGEGPLRDFDVAVNYDFQANERYRIHVTTPNFKNSIHAQFDVYQNGKFLKRLRNYYSGVPLDQQYTGRFSSTGGNLSFAWALDDGDGGITAPDVYLDVKIYAQPETVSRLNVGLDGIELLELEDARDQQIELVYSVDLPSKYKGPSPIVDFWFLNAEGGGIRKFAEMEVNMRSTAQHSVTLPSELLHDIPKGAVSIAAILDGGNDVVETNEEDNFLEVNLPNRLVNTNLRINKLTWEDAGPNKDGVEVTYRLQKGQMPSELNPVAKLFWSNSPLVPDNALPAYEHELSWDMRDGSFTVSPGVLGRTWTNQRFLIAVVEMPDDVPRDEYRARRKHITTAAVDGNVAPGLGNFSPAPARIKVASWIAQNKRTITRTARTFRISSEALASAIAYQALTDTTNTSGLVDLFSYDAMAVEGTATFRRGFITPKPEDVRNQPIGASETIQYVAGIMRGYSVKAKQQGFRINKDVAQLVSLFSNRLRRGSSDVPESLYTGISPSLLPQGGAFSAANHSLGTPLFTQSIDAAKDRVEVYSWDQRPFDRRQQTFVLTHGFQSSPAAWAVGAAQALRERFPDSNILLVDWSRIADEGLLDFNKPAGLTLAVGRGIGQRLATDKNIDVDPNKLHFIGHSLGAHVSGAAATAVTKATQIEVQQITALDPAGPIDLPDFLLIDPAGNFQDLPEQYRLDPGDAKRVVALHTTKILGYASEIGDLDLFVNWDENKQPSEDIISGILLGGNHGYSTELLRLLAGGHPFSQSSVFDVGSHLDWNDLVNTNLVNKGGKGLQVSTKDIPDSGFGILVSPQHLLVRGAVDTKIQYEFSGRSMTGSFALDLMTSDSFKLSISKAQVILTGDSDDAVVTLLTLERPISGVRPINATGRNLAREFPKLELPGRLAQQVQRAIGTQVTRSGHINLGTANYYFKRLNENGRQLRPNRQIANWVQANSSFISEAMLKGTSRLTRVLKGDVNDDLEHNDQDTAALRSMIARSSTMSGDELRTALTIGDMNDDGLLNALDVQIVQEHVNTAQMTVDAKDDHITVVNGTTTEVDVLSNDDVSRKASVEIVWIDQPVHGRAEVVGRSIHYTPDPLFVGEDSIRYVIETEYGQLSEATMRVVVLPVTLDANVLAIPGSGRDDLVELSESEGGISITVNGQTASLPANAVTSVLFDGGEGNDRFVNQTSKHSVAYGGAGNDELVGGNGIDEFFGGLGDDLLFGGGSNDRLFGNDGNDRIFGQQGSDFLDGGAGNDFINGQRGNDEIFGGHGNDHLIGGQGDDVLRGDDGDDRLEGDDGDDTLEGGAGNDTIFGGNGADTLRGAAGNDGLRGGSGMDWLDGGEGDDHLHGGRGNDTLLGQSGNDTLEGRDGDDRLEGGDGNDVLYGNSGNDVMLGQAGNDAMYGEEGNDTMRGGQGDDFLRGDGGDDDMDGGDGNDHLQGRRGNDFLKGSSGNDTLEGGNGDDRLEGGDGNDTLYGNAGHDAMFGNAGNDNMFGETGNDTMRGGYGDDFIRGDRGDDHLIGGYGNDHMKGENGNDFLEGGDGHDLLEGGAGNDHLQGGDGVDIIYGNGGNDLLSGGSNTDYLFGGRGDDRLYGNDGNDYMDGGHGNDAMDGRSDSWWAARKRRFRGWIWG